LRLQAGGRANDVGNKRSTIQPVQDLPDV